MADAPAGGSAEMPSPDRKAEFDSFRQAFLVALRGVEADPWFAALDAHTRTYAREAVALTLMGEVTRSGLPPSRYFALKNAPKAALVDSWAARIVKAADYARGYRNG